MLAGSGVIDKDTFINRVYNNLGNLFYTVEYRYKKYMTHKEFDI